MLVRSRVSQKGEAGPCPRRATGRSCQDRLDPVQSHDVLSAVSR